MLHLSPEDPTPIGAPWVLSILASLPSLAQVNSPPLTRPDHLVIATNSLVDIPVTVNDEDADGDHLIISAVTLPSHGTAVITDAPDETIRYQPQAHFNGLDSFEYKVTDGCEESSLQSVHIRVEPFSTQTIPAFPGAQGPGAITRHARSPDLRVIYVTHLSDDIYEGSLRAAIEADGPRIVAFKKGGTIRLNRRLNIDNPWLYVAGQTAPGGGITLAGRPAEGNTAANATLIWVRTHDVCIRYVRLRCGLQGFTSSGNSQGAIQARGQNLIFDHLSISWNHDDNGPYIQDVNFNGFGPAGSRTGFGFPIYNQTWQHCIFSEALRAHHTSFLIGGDREMYGDGETPSRTDDRTPRALGRYVSDISIHRNLFAHNGRRNPQGHSVKTQIVNNVVYNWRWYAMQTIADAQWDVRSNYFRPGPMTQPGIGSQPFYILHEGNSINKPHLRHDRDSPLRGLPSLFIDKNIFSPLQLIPRLSTPQIDQWAYVGQAYDSHEWAAGEVLPVEWQRPSPLTLSGFPVSVTTANVAYWAIQADVGANRELLASGQLAPRQDAVDSRVIAEVYLPQGGGVTNSPESEEGVGGYPILAEGTPYADGDADGMSDLWEMTNQLDPLIPEDARQDKDGDGYLNVEEFLNGTPP